MGEHGVEAGSRSHFAAESRVRVRVQVCYLGDCDIDKWQADAEWLWSGCAAASRLARLARNPLADDVVSLPQRAWLASSGSGCAELCWLIINQASMGRIPQITGSLVSSRNINPGAGVRCRVVAGEEAYDQKVKSTESAVTHTGSQGRRHTETQGCRWRSSGTMRFFSIKRRSAHSLAADEHPGCPAWLPCLAALAWPSELGAADGPRRAAPRHWPGPDAL